MQTIINTRCTKGRFIVYEDKVEIGISMLGIHNTNTLTFQQITGVEVKTTMAKVPLLSPGAATVTIYATGNQKLEAHMVKLEDAKKAEAFINEKLASNSKGQNGSSDMNNLEKLAELKDKGVITQEEFDQKKKQLLGL